MYCFKINTIKLYLMWKAKQLTVKFTCSKVKKKVFSRLMTSELSYASKY